MKKKSYNNRIDVIKSFYSGQIPEPKPNSEGMGGRGYVLPGECAMPLDDEEGVTLKGKERKNHADYYDKLTELLLNVSDEMDKRGEHKLASFSDFLIKKISNAKLADYEKMLNELLIKINESDMLNKQDILINIVKSFNNKFLEQQELGDLKRAKREAYMSAALEAERYVK